MGRPTLVTKTKIVVIAAILALGGSVLFWQIRDAKPVNAPPSAPPATQQVKTENVTYQGEDGKTALELLKAHAQVETKTSSLGELVTAINGNDGGGTKFWLFYVNGVESQVGAGAYMTKTGETIEWKLK